MLPCETAVPEPIDVPEAEGEIETIGDRYCLTDSQMANIEAQIGNARFQITELTRHRSILCEYARSRIDDHNRIVGQLTVDLDEAQDAAAQGRLYTVLGVGVGLGLGLLAGTALGAAAAH